jgi:hypothetical protein
MRKATVRHLKTLFKSPAFAIYVFLTAMDSVTTLCGVLPGLTREMNPLWAWLLPGHPVVFSIARMLAGIAMISFFYAPPRKIELWLGGGQERPTWIRNSLIWVSNVPLLLVVISNIYQIHRALEQ